VTEEAELPETGLAMSLADVRHDPVGPDDDLLAGLFVLFSSFLFDSHDPATREPSLRSGARRRRVPSGCRRLGPQKLEAQDVAPRRSAGRTRLLSRAMVFKWVRTMRSTMRRAQFPRSHFPPCFEIAKGRRANLEAVLVGFVPLGHARP